MRFLFFFFFFSSRRRHTRWTGDWSSDVCSSDLVLVERGMYGRLVEALARAFGAIRIGPGSTDPDMGPLISKVQLDRVLGYIEQGKTVARLVTGGGVPADPELADGFFVEPTIFDEVPPGSSIAQEEIFGPVLSVMEFGDAAEAVALANGTSFGLAAGVWTNAVGLAHWLASELRVSQVFVNNYAAAGGVELPFGGCKKSGFGREKGFAALHEYSRTKAITVRTVMAFVREYSCRAANPFSRPNPDFLQPPNGSSTPPAAA